MKSKYEVLATLHTDVVTDCRFNAYGTDGEREVEGKKEKKKRRKENLMALSDRQQVGHLLGGPLHQGVGAVRGRVDPDGRVEGSRFAHFSFGLGPVRVWRHFGQLLI